MKYKSPTINPKFVPDATANKPAPPRLPFLETPLKQSQTTLLEHGYSFAQIGAMNGTEFVQIYETLREMAGAPIAKQIANPFAKQ